MSAIFSLEKEKSTLLIALLIMSATAIPIASVKASPAEIHVYQGQSIQAAIDAANPGDTIIVHEGTYEEQLFISKPLTLRAAEGETVIIKPPPGTLATVDVEYPVPGGSKTRTFAPLIRVMEVTPASSVIIEGLIINGSYELIDRGYIGTKDPIYTGIVYVESNGTIRNCVIRNFRPKPEQTDLFNNGFAIWIVGDSHATVEGNDIHDYGWMGIVVDGFATVTIIDNSITGWGPTIQTGQNGIQVSRGAYAKILSNLITGNIYTGEDWWASGVIFLDATGDVIGNAIVENQVGVDGMGDVTGIHVNFNNIYGNTLAGVYNEDTGSLDAKCNWWNDPEGPTVGAPPESGDAVYGNVEYSPWLTAPLMADPDGTGVVASSLPGTDETLEFPDSNVDVVVSGSAEVYVATYESNPGTGFMGDIGNYIDVYVPDVSGLTELEIRKYYTDGEIKALGLDERGLKLYWWNGTDWVLCSDTGVNTVENYIWARIGADTTPSLSDLTGTPFGAASVWPVGGIILPVDLTPYMLMLILVAAGIAGIILKKTIL